MAWVDTASETFLARHDERDEEDAARVLAQLEFARTRLEERFDDAPRRALRRPALVGRRSSTPPSPGCPSRAASPRPRRAATSSAGPARASCTCSRPRLLAHRASNVEGSLEMLMLAPSALLARRYVADSHPKLPPPLSPPRVARWSRWAWLVEGAAQWLSGQTRHVRPAVQRRLREGAAPTFPPARADALLLGGTVFDLLAREEGDRACVDARPRPAPRRADPGARDRLPALGAAHRERLALAPGAAV